MANSKSLKIVQQFAKLLTEGNGFDKIFRRINIVSAGEGKCQAEMVVAQEDLNKMGTLHGGMIASIVDVITTYAHMTNPSGAPGVSVDINVQYINAALEGDVLVFDASTLKSGKRLAFLEIDITNKNTGRPIAKGTHTKYVG